MFFSLRNCVLSLFFFFFNDTATTEIYTLSLHDALPISQCGDVMYNERPAGYLSVCVNYGDWTAGSLVSVIDRKSTRLNSSHANISYAVFCLKKKKENPRSPSPTYVIRSMVPHTSCDRST